MLSNYKTTGRLLTAVVLIAVIALSSGSAFAKKRGGQGHGQGPRPRISNLDPAQREKLQKHFRESRGRLMDARMQLRDARMELYRRLGEYDLDERGMQEDIRGINSLQLRLLHGNLESQLRLREILTKEQFDDLRDAVGEPGMHREDAWMWPGDGARLRGNVDRLGLSAEQREQIARLWRSSRASSEGLIGKLRSESEALQRTYLDYDLDPKQARAQIERLNDTQLNLLKATVSRQMGLRRILTEEQFESLSKTVRRPGRPGPRRR
ncbi:MAG: periplasmic heavy metal sensor [Armatimonadetes bacterium]|nr:periplasmic heavy metal sensor [Armatimonadota bacterium]